MVTLRVSIIIATIFVCILDPSVQASTITLSQSTRRLVVSGQELNIDLHVAKNTLTQKSVTYVVKLRDKFNRLLYQRMFDVPFSSFAEDAFQNSVDVVPLVGETGEGLAIRSSVGSGHDLVKKVDILSIRPGGNILTSNTVVVVPITNQMIDRFMINVSATPNATRTKKTDVIIYKMFASGMYINAPLKINWGGGIEVLPNVHEFTVDVPSFRRGGGKIAVYSKPEGKANSAFLTVGPTANVKFLGAHGTLSLKGQQLQISGLSLRVEVNGKSGWMRDLDSFSVLGLQLQQSN